MAFRSRVLWTSNGTMRSIVEDTRRDYGERRFLAYGPIESRLYVLVHTPREGRVHVISLRKANKREVRV